MSSIRSCEYERTNTNNLGKVTGATPDKSNFLKQPRRSTTHVVIEGECVCCNNALSINKCKTFHDFSVKQRWEFCEAAQALL
jgi:hypothetical protein